MYLVFKLAVNIYKNKHLLYNKLKYLSFQFKYFSQRCILSSSDIRIRRLLVIDKIKCFAFMI